MHPPFIDGETEAQKGDTEWKGTSAILAFLWASLAHLCILLGLYNIKYLQNIVTIDKHRQSKAPDSTCAG